MSVMVKSTADRVPAPRISFARPRLDIVPVHIFHAVVIGPLLLARHGASLAAQAFVQIHHHGVLMCRHWKSSRFCDRLPDLVRGYPLELFNLNLDISVISGGTPIVQLEIEVPIFA